MALTMSLMMLVSCNKDKKDPKEAVFTANIEQHIGQQNRTVINPENGDVKWLAGDKILVANGNGFHPSIGRGNHGRHLPHHGRVRNDRTVCSSLSPDSHP